MIRILREAAISFGLFLVAAVIMFVVMLLMSGCAIVDPEVPQPTGPGAVEVGAPVGAEEAEALVLSEWSWRVESELDDPPPVRWFAGPCLTYEPSRDCYIGMYAHKTGLLGRAQEIHLVVGDRPSDTEIAHEFLHWALYEVGRDDPWHSEPEWVDLDEVNESLRQIGL